EPVAKHAARGVQPNFPEVQQYEANWFQNHTADIEELVGLSLRRSPRGPQPDLLVWPEAPAPFSFQDAQFAKLSSSLAQLFHGPFVAGAIEWRPAFRTDTNKPRPDVAYNSALLFDTHGQRLFVYDKIHLVPFGEYEPFPLIHQVVRSVSEE